MQIKILKAGNGDSILITLKNENNGIKNILIDGGNNFGDYKENLKSEILNIQEKKEFIDLLIITHIDQDHIKGIEFLLNDKQIDKTIIKEVWFNSFSKSSTINNDISSDEALRVEKLINNYKLVVRRNLTIEETPKIIFSDVTFNLLSPHKKYINSLITKNKDISKSIRDHDFSIQELITKNPKIFIDNNENLDTSLENISSLAFMIEYKEYKILLLGDAEAPTIHETLKTLLKERNIEKFDINYTKLSHHGSHKNLSIKLFNYINCNNFIISTNGKKDNLPNKLSFAKILHRPNKSEIKDYFYFNYTSVMESLNFTASEQREFKFECFSENYSKGYKIEL